MYLIFLWEIQSLSEIGLLDFIPCTEHNIKVSTSSFSALSSQEILQRDLIFQKSGWICKKCPSEEKFEQKFQFVSHWHKKHSRGVTYEVCQWCCELFDYPSISQNVSSFSPQFSNISRCLVVSFALEVQEKTLYSKRMFGVHGGSWNPNYWEVGEWRSGTTLENCYGL